MKTQIMIVRLENMTTTFMKQIVKLLIFAFIFIVSSCVKEGCVCYRFEVYNLTNTPMTVHLSSWGSYSMYINGLYSSKYKFHEVETIQSKSSLIFSAEVGDDPDPYQIPASIIPAWEHIVAIECNGVAIPKEYFSNPENWEINVANQINGTFSNISLYISTDLVERISQNRLKNDLKVEGDS